jgi:hypothetical protein
MLHIEFQTISDIILRNKVFTLIIFVFVINISKIILDSVGCIICVGDSFFSGRIYVTMQHGAPDLLLAINEL